jgi:hypothetical protein
MTWRLATSFVLTAEMRLSVEGSAEEAILAVGGPRRERVGLVQRIRRRDPLTLTSPEWLTAEQIDETYSSSLPSRKSEITIDEIAELTAVFGENGEMAAERRSGGASYPQRAYLLPLACARSAPTTTA